MTQRDISAFLSELTALSRKHDLHIEIDWPKMEHTLGGDPETLVTVREGGESVYYMHLEDENTVFLMSRERARESIAKLTEELESPLHARVTDDSPPAHTHWSRKILGDEIARQKAYLARMDEIDREIATQGEMT